MELKNLSQPPCNTTFMGVLMGALNHYGIATSTATLYGGSGHAFLINIHEKLCPSGPYVWRTGPMLPRIANLGLKLVDLGFFSPDSTEDQRREVEGDVCRALDQDIPCALINMEYQLITGYDYEGLHTAQPWPAKPDYPPARLTFNTWAEWGNEIHASFWRIERATPAERLQVVLDSLDYAVDVHTNPDAHAHGGYGIGPDAYANWIAAVPEHGAGHGNWWNGTIWSECRKEAANWCAEIAGNYTNVASTAKELQQAYEQIAKSLQRISDKKMPPSEKIALLKQTRDDEAAAIRKAGSLAEALRESSVGASSKP